MFALLAIGGLLALLVGYAAEQRHKGPAGPGAPPSGGTPQNVTALQMAAQSLRAVLGSYAVGSPEVANAAREYAKVAGIKLVPGAGYVEAVRESAAKVLGLTPSQLPQPSEGVF